MTATLEPLTAAPLAGAPDPLSRIHLDAAIDRAQVLIGQLPPAEAPVTHHFTPGLYAREIFMRAGLLIVSKIHKTRHPFVISKGRVSVWDPFHGVQVLRAPHFGITEPGTRRILFVHEDCVWQTFHVTPHTDVAAIEAEIIEPHDIHPELEAEVLRQLKGTV